MNRVTRRILLFSTLLWMVLIVGCASSKPADPDQKTDARKAAESNTQLGLQYMNRGQLEVALGKLKKAVREDPGYAPGHTVLAVLYERLGERELAGNHYKKAVLADPKNGDVNNNYGVFLCKTRDEKQAIPYLLKSLDDPFYSSPAVALTNAGNCEMNIDKLTDAENHFRTALRYDANFPDALLSMANLNYRQNKYLGARAFLQRYEAATNQTADSLFLGYEIETALHDQKTAGRYLSLLNTKFPDSKEAEKARGIKRK